MSPEPSAFDELSLTRLGSLGGTGAVGKGGVGDDMQTIYGGSGGMGGGMGTETSSLLDSQSDYDVTVKCIVQCPQLFGEGVSVDSQISWFKYMQIFRDDLPVVLTFLIFFFFARQLSFGS